jgi:hypothetical protein
MRILLIRKGKSSIWGFPWGSENLRDGLCHDR